MLEFIDAKTFYTILHLIGVAFGAGGAYISGFIFLSSIKDNKLSGTEIRFLKLSSSMVWTGVFILVVSGILIFYLDPEKYLASSKFLAKMTIVGVVIFNGILYHVHHIPVLIEKVGKKIHFEKYKSLFISGAVSFVSWTFALVLGVLRGVPYNYLSIMAVYVLLLLISMAGALAFRKKII